MDARQFNVDDATVRSETQRPADDSANDAGNGADHEALDQVALEGEQTVITSGQPASVPSQPPGVGSPADVARVLLGHRLSHFFLETLVGGGGMGAVFRARDTRLDRTVAIKVIPRVGEDAELQRRFRNKAQSAARLDHPNIARVYDVGQHGGWHYIVFEYIDGTNLRDLVQTAGVLSVDDAVYYTRQVAEALDHAHRRGVVHRDIKPSNVLITTEGQAKLVDMGLARAQQLEMSEDMTASGVTLGTFDYISPEQARDPRDADVRSDIYSLGCTLYFALTGSPPYPSGTVLQKLLSHGSSPPPDPRRMRTGLSKSLVAVLHRMLAKDPADRYQKPLDLVSDLYLLAARDSLPRSMSAGSITVAPPSRFGRLVERHLPWVLAASILLISVAWLQIMSGIGGGLQITSPPPKPPTTDSATNTNSATNTTSPVRDNTEPPASTLTTPAVAASGTAIDPAPLLPAATTSNADSPPTGAQPDRATVQTPAAAVVQPTIVRILGSDTLRGGTIDAENRLLVSSMAEAIEAVNSEPAFQTIEVEGVTVRSGPIALPTRRLVIRGTSPLSELILQQTSRESLIELGADELVIEDLRLSWRVAGPRFDVVADDRSVDGTDFGSLFSLTAGSRVRLDRSLVTIEQPVNSVLRGDASLAEELPVMFSYRSPPTIGLQNSSFLDLNSDSPELLEIELNDCIVRGEMTMLDLKDPVSVDLRWDNGLLAVRGSMLRSVGVRPPIPFLTATDNSRVQMVLNDLTIATGETMFAVDCREKKQPVIVDRLANRCVFIVEDGQALVQVTGVQLTGAQVTGGQATYDPNRWLALRGRDNQYHTVGNSQTVVLAEASTKGPVRQVDSGQLTIGTAPNWITESNARWSVRWSGASFPKTANSRRSPQDYRQSSSLAPGFRPTRLPSVERVPEVENGPQTTVPNPAPNGSSGGM